MKKIAVLVLVSLMLLPLAVGCADNNDSAADTTPAESTSVKPDDDPGSTNTTKPSDETTLADDNISDDVDLKNETITFLYWSDTEMQEFVADDQNGEAVNDAIYYRNLETELRLKVKLAFVETLGNYSNLDNFNKKASTDATSGNSEFDIFADYSMGIATLAASGYTRDLRQYDAIDFTKPWWPANLLEESTIYDKLYFASGDISTNMLYMMYCCFFNKSILTAHGLESPYALVDANQWTLDKMIEMSANIYVDDDGDSTKSKGDIYGFSCTSNVHFDPFYYSAGLKTMDKSPDGTPIVSDDMTSEKAINLVKKVKEFLNDNDYSYTDSKIFAEGRALFQFNKVQEAARTFKNGTFDYGIVPVPKYDANQDNFSTVLAFPYSLYAISFGTKLDEDAAIVLECMGSEGYRQITPVLFEDCMKSKYVSDNETAKMYDILRETVSFDIGRIFTESFQKITYQLFRNSVSSADAKEYSSEATSQKRTMDKIARKFASDFSKMN